MHLSFFLGFFERNEAVKPPGLRGDESPRSEPGVDGGGVYLKGRPTDTWQIPIH